MGQHERLNDQMKIMNRMSQEPMGRWPLGRHHNKVEAEDMNLSIRYMYD